jgi:hypothetical protein
MTILNALKGRAIPLYGDGKNVRDWLYVEDHCSAIDTVLRFGRPGETYNVGGSSEKMNIEVVRTICQVLNELTPVSKFRPHAALIMYVPDRPGDDRRYAINPTKLTNDLGWQPQHSLRSGIHKTIEWYLSHKEWLESLVRCTGVQSMRSGPPAGARFGQLQARIQKVGSVSSLQYSSCSLQMLVLYGSSRITRSCVPIWRGEGNTPYVLWSVKGDAKVQRLFGIGKHYSRIR